MFDWREYLELARFLQTITGSGFSSNAACRSAVSRAYYAAFCHARNYARDRLGFVPSGEARDHTLVREHLKNRGMVNIAAKLESLRRWRNSCDYDDAVPSIPRIVSAALSTAESVFEVLV